MTTTTADKGEQECREAFEQNANKIGFGPLSRKDDGSYRNNNVEASWINWRTSWAAAIGAAARVCDSRAEKTVASIFNLPEGDPDVIHARATAWSLTVCAEQIRAIARHLSSKQPK